MAIKDLSKSELVSILEIIEGARLCASGEDLRRLILKAKDVLEAEYAICGIAEVSGTGSVTDAVTIVNGNCPREWLVRYASERMYLNDPVVRHHARFSSTLSWDVILKEARDDMERSVIGFGRDFGMRHGISGSVYIPDSGDMSLFAFSGGSDTFKKHHREIIDILMLHLNRAIVNVTYRAPLLALPDFGASPVQNP